MLFVSVFGLNKPQPSLKLELSRAVSDQIEATLLPLG
jgi:hypothetical protein